MALSVTSWSIPKFVSKLMGVAFWGAITRSLRLDSIGNPSVKFVWHLQPLCHWAQQSLLPSLV